jgi:hypothetical protein
VTFAVARKATFRPTEFVIWLLCDRPLIGVRIGVVGSRKMMPTVP